MSEINFDEILKKVEKQPKVEVDWNRTLKIKRVYDSSVRVVYEVNLPREFPERIITDLELITRCDNNKPDLDDDTGEPCHFGGTVVWNSHRNAMVTVYID